MTIDGFDHLVRPANTPSLVIPLTNLSNGNHKGSDIQVQKSKITIAVARGPSSCYLYWVDRFHPNQ
eukprot:5723877-Pleurochrysis_carterae.AAC.6